MPSVLAACSRLKPLVFKALAMLCASSRLREVRMSVRSSMPARQAVNSSGAGVDGSLFVIYDKSGGAQTAPIRMETLEGGHAAWG